MGGNWKEQFSPEAREVFNRHAGRELILSGYEKDHGWVKDENVDDPAGRGA